MSKEHQENDFDPSNDEEFIKTIENLFKEEAEDRLPISIDDSNIIDIEECDKENKSFDLNSEEVNPDETEPEGNSYKVDASHKSTESNTDKDEIELDIESVLSASINEVMSELEAESDSNAEELSEKESQLSDQPDIEISAQDENDVDFELIFENLDVDAPITVTHAFGQNGKETDSDKGKSAEAGVNNNQKSEPDSGLAIIQSNDTDGKSESEIIVYGDQTDLDNSEVSNTVADDDFILEDINANLAEQVNLHLQNEPVKKNRMFFIPKWLRILLIVLGSVFIFSFIMFKTPVGVKLVSNLAGRILADGMSTPAPDGEVDPNLTITPDPNDVDLSEITGDVDLPSDSLNGDGSRTEDYITNILLLGEENMDSYGANGRTDLMIIATIDTKNDVIKLTSLMRDMLVSLPGYDDNRLNAAYAKGGIDLLYATIERNFNITVDGYMLVGFDDFESVVDILGGVDIEVNNAEREWLNSTNYISNPDYRTLITGWNHMNGNQALGYCRIRQVATSDNKYSDFGRTSRQRIMLNAMFDEVKTKNALELINIMNKCLPYVTTNITADQMSDYIEDVLTNKITTIEEMQIPVAGSYSDVQYNGLGALISVNFTENIEALHKFIFGDYQE